MKQLQLDFPTRGFVVMTRAALGAGVGLLLAGRLTEAQRRAVGTALIGIGAATTLPAVMALRHAAQRGPA